MFRAIDTNKKGYLQLQDMQVALQSEEVSSLFEKITGGKMDKIDFSVFQAIGLDRSVLISEQNLKNMFNSIAQK